MKPRFPALLFCLTFFFILSACAEDSPNDLQGVVTWVYDGDTLEVDPVGKVRMLGIDAPERKSSKRDQFLLRQGVSESKLRDIYHKAKRFNIEHVKGSIVTLSPGDPPRDKYDRLLAYVYLPDGRILNRVLIEKGLAVVYRRFSFEKKEDFLDAEARAQEMRLGLWAGQIKSSSSINDKEQR